MALPAASAHRERLEELKLTVAQLLILALLSAIPLAGQNEEFNEATSDTLPAAAVAVEEETPRPKTERVFDKKFFAVMGSLGAAESLRFTSRKIILEREYAAGAPWVTSVPSRSRTAASR